MCLIRTNRITSLSFAQRRSSIGGNAALRARANIGLSLSSINNIVLPVKGAVALFTLLQMPLTPAERQKLYRERLKEKNHEKFLAQKIKNADRTREKRKKIAEYAPSEQENIRKQWIDRKNKNKEEPSSSIPEIMPSAKDPQVLKQKRNQNRRVLYKLKQENIALKTQQMHTQKILKKIKKRLNRCIQKNNKLLEIIKEKNNLIRDLEERLIPGDIIERNLNEITPASKTDAYIQQNLPDILPEEKERVKKNY